jgi:hypothetical protein
VNKTEIAKRVVSTVVGLGTTKIVNDVIANNTTAEKLHEKVEVKAGAVVMGMVVADQTSKYTDQKIDEITAWWSKNVTARQTAN